MKLTSPDFSDKESIPSSFTCDGTDISPELHIRDVPRTAKSLALVMEDPDAPSGMFVHWIVWNIPPGVIRIPKGNEPEGVQGKTDFRSLGYGGPCPPNGTHRYYFKLFALDCALGLKEGSSRLQLLSAMDGHVLSEAVLMGMYKRV